MAVIDPAPSSLEARIDATEEWMASDPSGALAALGQIRDEAADDPAAEGRAAYLMARLATEGGDHDAALRHLNQAARAFTLAGDQLSAHRTVLGRMHVLDNLGRHSEAIELGAAALDDLSAEDRIDDDWLWLSGAVSDNLAASQGLIGQHRDAMSSLNRAEHVYRALGDDESLRRVAATRGVELLEVGDYRASIATMAGAAEDFAADGNEWWYGAASTHLARAHLGAGSISRALGVAERADQALTDIGADAEALRARLVSAGAHLATGDITQSAASAWSVAVRAAELGQTGERAAAWFLIGLALAGRGRLAGATRALGRSAAYYAEAGEVRGEARARLARAEFALDQAEAERDLRWVRRRLEEDDAPLEHARAAVIAARWYEGAGDAHVADFLERLQSTAPAQLVEMMRTHLGRFAVATGSSGTGLELLRAASQASQRRRHSIPWSQRWRTNAMTATDQLIDALVDVATPAALDEAARLVDNERRIALDLDRSAGRAVDTGPRLIAHDATDRTVLFACDGGAVVGHHVVAQTLVAERARAVANAVELSILTGGGAAGAMALERAITDFWSVLDLDRLLGTLGEPSTVGWSPSPTTESVPALFELPTQLVLQRAPLPLATAPAGGGTLFVDCGAEDLPAVEMQLDELRSTGIDLTILRRPALDELTDAIRDHATVHLAGHGHVTRHGAHVDFGDWQLDEPTMRALPLAGTTVVLDVCHGAAADRGRSAHGGLSTAAAAAGALAVIGSPWPVVDGLAPTASASLHRSLADGLAPVAALSAMTSCLRADDMHPIAWAGWTLESLHDVRAGST